jgi:hypothetical protein
MLTGSGIRATTEACGGSKHGDLSHMTLENRRGGLKYSDFQSSCLILITALRRVLGALYNCFPLGFGSCLKAFSRP